MVEGQEVGAVEYEEVEEAVAQPAPPSPTRSSSTAVVRSGGGAVVRGAPGMGGLLRPAAQPAEVVQAQSETRELIARALAEGRDYGTIPGTDKKRKVLLKPGAERINAGFAVYATYEIVEQEVDHDRLNTYSKKVWHPTQRGVKIDGPEETSRGLYRYVLKCLLVHRESGAVIGEGVGSCSSMESKYIDRPRDVENTVLKMAKKRAYVDATLSAYGLSDEFTQDVEEQGGEEQGGGGNGHREGQRRGRQQQQGGDGPILERVCPMQRAQGKTWGELVAAGGQARGLVHWAVKNFDSLSDEEKAVLVKAMADAKAAEAEASGQGDMMDPQPEAPPPFTKKSGDRLRLLARQLREVEVIDDAAVEGVDAWLEGMPCPTEEQVQLQIKAGQKKLEAHKGKAKASDAAGSAPAPTPAPSAPPSAPPPTRATTAATTATASGPSPETTPGYRHLFDEDEEA